MAFRSLVEGDAMLTEYRYRFSLSEAQLQAVDDADSQTSKEAKARLSATVEQSAGLGSGGSGQSVDRPSAALQVEIDLAEFPYVQGTEFAASLWKRLSPKDYNQLFRHPPKSTGSVLYPGRDPSIGGDRVKSSALRAGQVRYGKGGLAFGPLHFLVAMERTGNSADGQLVASAWRGESMSVFEDRIGHRVCFSTDISFGGDSAILARGALSGWAARRGLSASVVGEIVHLEGCDPFGTT